MRALTSYRRQIPNELLLEARLLSAIDNKTENKNIWNTFRKSNKEYRWNFSLKEAEQTQYSSSSTASRAMKRPKFRLCNPEYPSSVCWSRLKASSGNFALSCFDRGECLILWSFLQCTSIFFHLSYETGKASLGADWIQSERRENSEVRWFLSCQKKLNSTPRLEF